MKFKFIFFLIASMAILACQNNKPKSTETVTQTDTTTVLKADTVKTVIPTEIEYSLALSANAIQIINTANGASREIAFGMPYDELLKSVNKILNQEPNTGINSECGAGPLKMATWDNGLTLIFQEKKNEWLFVGWAANKAKNADHKITTMASIGVGSTREEMESAYVIKVNKTSLGYEFSTKTDDLFGIFDGPGPQAKITNLWSGLSCNFR